MLAESAGINVAADRLNVPRATAGKSTRKRRLSDRASGLATSVSLLRALGATGTRQRVELWTSSLTIVSGQQQDRSSDDHLPGGTALFIGASLCRRNGSRPIDELVMLRDEMANLVQAVEVLTPSADGGSRDGAPAAARVRKRTLERLGRGAALKPLLTGAELDYRLMSAIQGHQFPC